MTRAAARGFAAVLRVNARLAAIDAEEPPRPCASFPLGHSTGVRVKAAPDLTLEQRARIERLLVTTGFA